MWTPFSQPASLATVVDLVTCQWHADDRNKICVSEEVFKPEPCHDVRLRLLPHSLHSIHYRMGYLLYFLLTAGFRYVTAPGACEF